MIPQMEDDLRKDFTMAERQTSRTYRIDIEKGRIYDDTDQLEAMKQAIYKIVNTERYRHAIYSWQYGIELADLLGKSKSYVFPELKRRIEEALTQDDRILSVDSFEFETIAPGAVRAAFTVHTIFGNIDWERTVNY